MTVCSSKNKEVIKMPQEVIKKNHMDVAWHEYTDENGENVPVVRCQHRRESIHYRTCGDYVSLMRYRSLESKKFHEHIGRSTWHYMYGGYWSDVY